MKETFENWRLFLQENGELDESSEEEVLQEWEPIEWLPGADLSKFLYGWRTGETGEKELADKTYMAAAGDTSVPMGIRGKFQPGWAKEPRPSYRAGASWISSTPAAEASQGLVAPPKAVKPKRPVRTVGGVPTTVPASPPLTGAAKTKQDIYGDPKPKKKDPTKATPPVTGVTPTGGSQGFKEAAIRNAIDNVINELLDDSPQKRVGDPSYIQSIYEITIKVSIHKTRGGDREQTFTEIRGIPNVTVVSVDPTGTSRDETFYYSTLNCKFELSGNENAKEYLRLLFFPGIRDIKGLTLKHAGNLQKLL